MYLAQCLKIQGDINFFQRNNAFFNCFLLLLLFFLQDSKENVQSLINKRNIISLSLRKIFIMVIGYYILRLNYLQFLNFLIIQNIPIIQYLIS